MRLRLICAIAALAATACLAESVTYPLKLTPYGKPLPAYAFLSWSDQVPEDAGSMPRFAGAGACFAELKLGDGKPVLLAATSGGTAQAPKVTLYVDTDGDRSLADEKPLLATRPKSPDQQFEGELVTPAVTVPVVYDLPGGRVTRDLTFRLATPPRVEMSPYMILVVDRVMGGTIKLGEREVQVRLLDQNCDGKVSVLGSDEGAPDMLWVGLDPKKPEAGETRPLTRYLEDEGRFYELAPRADGGEVTVTPYDGPTGKVSVSAADAEGKPCGTGLLYLASPTVQVLRRGGPAEVSLPPGTYGLTYSLGALKDGEPEYTFSQPKVEVAGGESQEIRCGGPLALSLEIEQGRREPGAIELSVTFQVRTEAGHAFSSSTRVADPPAKMVVLNAAKQIIGRGDGQYG
jgi:hypothetical protein